MGGFEFVVPPDRRIGVIDQHEGRSIPQANGLSLHGLLVLFHKDIAEVPEQRLGEREPPQRIPRGAKIDPALLFADRRDHHAHGDEHRSALDELKTLVGQHEVDGRRQRPSIEEIQ